MQKRPLFSAVSEANCTLERPQCSILLNAVPVRLATAQLCPATLLPMVLSTLFPLLSTLSPLLGTASPVLSAALLGRQDAISMGDQGTRELLAHPRSGTATAQKVTPIHYLISHKPLLVNAYKEIYFVISHVLLSKVDLVSKLY